jgi:hypothetical protein
VPSSTGGGGANKGLIIGLVVVIVLGLIGVGVVLLGGDDDDGDEVSTETTTTTEPSESTSTTEDTTSTTDAPTTTETSEPPVTDTIDVEGEFKSVFDLEEGDCWDDPEESSSQVNEVEVLPCDQPHDNEIYLVFDLPDGDFDATAVEEGSADGCGSDFEGFVGLDAETSELDFFAIYPTEATWAEGDREVVCSLYDEEFRKLVGSMEGQEV